MNQWTERSKSISGLIAAFLFLALAGCAATGPSVAPTAPPAAAQPDGDLVYGDIRIATVRSGDTIESLAGRYLNDPAKAWLIADFNEIETVSPGQKVIIPPPDYRLGGIYPEGYQVVPVLCYHNFSKKKIDKMVVPQARFEAQMKFLKDHGYQTITLDELFDFIDFKAPIPRKSVVISVDDGWLPFYEIAYPILKKYGFRATLFLYTDFVGGRKSVSWDQVKEMNQNGIEIQNHTKSHRNLTKIMANESFRQYFSALEEEIETGEKKLKTNAGITPHYLAYPYGDTNDLVVEILKRRGYRAAFTVARGGNPFYINNYRINRSVIYGDYDLKKFESNLSILKRF